MFEVRSRNLEYVGAFARVSDAAVVLRSNRDDTWTVTVPAEQAFQPAQGSTTLDDIICDGGGIRITDDTTGQVYLTGRLSRRSFLWNRGAGVITYSGKGDSEVLGWRLVRPDPLQPVSAQTKTHWVVRGNAETVMRQVVDINLGPDALAYRRLAFYRKLPSANAGNDVSNEYRFEPLNQVLFELAAAGGGLYYQIIQPGDEQALQLEIGYPRDLRDAVVFEPGNNNISEFTQEVSAPEMTAATIGGQGEMLARQFQEIDTYNSRWDRRVEGFVERSDTPDLALQRATALEQLREAAGENIVTFNTLDTPTLKYGVDYRLNDIVGVRIGTEQGGGAYIADGVRQVTLTWKKGSYWSAEPTVGPVDSEDYRKPKIFKRLSKLETAKNGGRIR